jgi:hypothetical protein
MRIGVFWVFLLAAVTAQAEEFKDDKGFRLGLDAPGWVLCSAVPPPVRSDPGCGDLTTLEKMARGSLDGQDAQLVALATVSRKDTVAVFTVVRIPGWDLQDWRQTDLLVKTIAQGASGAQLEHTDGQTWRRLKVGDVEAIRFVLGTDQQTSLVWLVPSDGIAYLVSFSTGQRDRELVEPLAVNAVRTVKAPSPPSSAFETGYRIAMMIARLFGLMVLIALVRWGFRQATSRSR